MIPPQGGGRRWLDLPETAKTPSKSAWNLPNCRPCQYSESFYVSKHLVRYGQLGIVGRFRCPDATVYPRSSRVICRTPRGLEVGEVLSPIDDATSADDVESQMGGEILRKTTSEGDLLQQRLILHRDEAFTACQHLLAEREVETVLVDVEVLFDGRNLIFYFLGEITSEAEAITNELAAAYEAKSQIGQFADTLATGCGPDCGTEEAAGCSSGACATCVVASACHKPTP